MVANYRKGSGVRRGFRVGHHADVQGQRQSLRPGAVPLRPLREVHDLQPGLPRLSEKRDHSIGGNGQAGEAEPEQRQESV